MSKTSQKIALGALGTIAGACAGLVAYSRIRFQRSACATILEAAQSPAAKALLPQDPGELRTRVDELGIVNEEPYELNVPMRSLVFDDTNDHMRTYYVGVTGTNAKAVLYLHGGLYARQIGPLDWFFVDRLAQKTGAAVLVPLYPLAPEHSYDEAYEHLLPLYQSMVARYGAPNITIVGVGSGGGLAAGIAEAMAEETIVNQPTMEQPGNLVLISPELDITLTNHAVYQNANVDPMHDPWMVRSVGQIWADGDDPESYRLSPLYGDVSGLRNVTVFAGTREVFYTDAVTFVDKLTAAGVSADLVEGHNLSHAWPLYPLPESRSAMAEICGIIGA